MNTQLMLIAQNHHTELGDIYIFNPFKFWLIKQLSKIWIFSRHIQNRRWHCAICYEFVYTYLYIWLYRVEVVMNFIKINYRPWRYKNAPNHAHTNRLFSVTVQWVVIRGCATNMGRLFSHYIHDINDPLFSSLWIINDPLFFFSLFV